MDTDPFWSVVCGFEGAMYYVLLLDLVLLILLLFAIPTVERGSATHSLVVIDALVLLISGCTVGYLFWRCKKRKRSIN